MTSVKFGIMFANTGRAVEGAGAVELAESAEAAGFESLWTVEHVVVPKGYQSPYPYSASGRMPGDQEDAPIPDPLIWMAYVAARTSRLLLGTGVLILPQRNPVVLAKEVATLDVLSGGRVRLGVGVGWLAEEFAAIGVPFEQRGARTDDHIRALRALWTEEVATYKGRFVDFDDVYCRPRPPSGPVPMVIGGHTPAAARRAGRLGDGFFPAKGSVEELSELFDIARRAAEDAGRDPDALEFTTGARPDREAIERLAAIGVHRVILNPGPPEKLARIGRELIEPLS